MQTKNVKQETYMKHSSKFMKDMIQNKIGKVSDIENMRRYFSYNSSQKTKKIQEIQITVKEKIS